MTLHEEIFTQRKATDIFLNLCIYILPVENIYDMVIAEVDMSNQIMNSWNKPTALAMVQRNLKCAILLDVNHKNSIKRECELNCKFDDMGFTAKKIKNLKRDYNCQVSSLVHAYLLHKLIIFNNGAVTDVQVCQDNPAKYVNRFLQIISNREGTWEKIKKIHIGYGLKKKYNSAQIFAKDVAKGCVKANYSLNITDLNKIIDYIRKTIQKPKKF